MLRSIPCRRNFVDQSLRFVVRLEGSIARIGRRQAADGAFVLVGKNDDGEIAVVTEEAGVRRVFLVDGEVSRVNRALVAGADSMCLRIGPLLAGIESFSLVRT